MRDLDIVNPVLHRHVTSVVTGHEPGRRERNWTVSEVRAAMALGDGFYTQSESTGKMAEIEVYTCEVCGQEWVRANDHVVENGKLESLPHANSDRLIKVTSPPG